MVPGWHYVVVCLVPHSRRSLALQVVAGALQRTMFWLLCLQLRALTDLGVVDPLHASVFSLIHALWLVFSPS